MIWHSHMELFCKSILRVGLKPVRQKLVNVLIQSNYYIWIEFVSNILLDFYLLAFKNSRAKKKITMLLQAALQNTIVNWIKNGCYWLGKLLLENYLFECMHAMQHHVYLETLVMDSMNIHVPYTYIIKRAGCSLPFLYTNWTFRKRRALYRNRENL